MKGQEVLITTMAFVLIVMIILVIGLLLYFVGFDIEGQVQEVYHHLSTKDITENLMIYVGDVPVDTGSGTEKIPLVNYFSYLLSMPQYIEDRNKNGGVMQTPEGNINTQAVYQEVKNAVENLRDGYGINAICLKLKKGNQEWSYYPEPTCKVGNVCCKYGQLNKFLYDCMSKDECSKQGSEVDEGFCCPGQEVCCRTGGLECQKGCDPIYTEPDESKCTGEIARCGDAEENEIFIPTFDGPGYLSVGVND